jgi:hypothetical protein
MFVSTTPPMENDDVIPFVESTSPDPDSADTCPLSVLVVVGDAQQRTTLVEAFRAAGVFARGVSSIAEIEQWPHGQIVVTDFEHVTPFWRTIGATEIIVVAPTVAVWKRALARGATGWLQTPVRSGALAIATEGTVGGVA